MKTLNIQLESLTKKHEDIVAIKNKEIEDLTAAALKRPNDYSLWWASGGVAGGIDYFNNSVCGEINEKRDLNEIAKIEKAIKEKYGEEAIQNPKGSWDQEKEAKYLEDLKAFYQRSSRKRRLKKLKVFSSKIRKQTIK